MKLICTKCQYELNIDDSRIPNDKPFKVKCPQCSESITGRAGSMNTQKTDLPQAAPASEWERLKPFVEDYVNRRMAAFRKELEASSQLPNKVIAFKNEEVSLSSQGSPKKALLCQSNSKIEQEVAAKLSNMGYQIVCVKSVKDAMKKLEQDLFELIATDSAFPDDPSGGKKILSKMNAKKFDQRRRTFVVLISPTLETSGPENAFLLGANLTVNIRDLNDLEQLIRQGQREFEKLSKDGLEPA
jgi:PleD family two-component response regulator